MTRQPTKQSAMHYQGPRAERRIFLIMMAYYCEETLGPKGGVEVSDNKVTFELTQSELKNLSEQHSANILHVWYLKHLFGFYRSPSWKTGDSRGFRQRSNERWISPLADFRSYRQARNLKPPWTRDHSPRQVCFKESALLRKYANVPSKRYKEHNSNPMKQRYHFICLALDSPT